MMYHERQLHNIPIFGMLKFGQHFFFISLNQQKSEFLNKFMAFNLRAQRAHLL